MSNEIAGLWQRAESHMAQRNGDGARAAYEAIVARDPRHAAAWLRLSTLASMRGHYREAVTAALAATSAQPADPSLRARLFERLLDVGESEVARNLFIDTELGAGTPAPVFAEFARLLSRLGDQSRALELVEAAYAKGLQTPPLRYLRATAQLFCGRIDDAEQELETCLRDAPNLVQAHWTLSKLRGWTLEHNHVERLRHATRNLATNDPSASYVFFALFKELEDTGRYDEAWQALVQGCIARRRGLHYDRARDEALFNQLIARCTPAFLSIQAPPADGPAPIFIVGQPRSGTTLLERILGAHSHVGDAGELYDFAFQLRWACNYQSKELLDEHVIAAADTIDYTELGRRYLAHTQWRSGGRPFYTDKLPPNFLQVGFIHRALPQAKILHMVRNPMDTCFSNMKELFGVAYPHSYDQSDMAAHFNNYQRLMEHWRRVLPGRILDVHYEELVAHPERIAREVLAFCGLPWEPGCVAIEQHAVPTSTASAVQVRQPIHQRNLGQWKHYEQQLEPLRRLLA